MADKRVFLKVKLKSLAEEARIIKHEEGKRKVRRARAIAGLLRNASDDVKAHIRMLRVTDAAHREEHRAQPWYPLSAHELEQLHRHRINVVRVESRLTSIAYAIIRGRMLASVDSLKGLTPAHWERINAMLKKYGDGHSVPAPLLSEAA